MKSTIYSREQIDIVVEQISSDITHEIYSNFTYYELLELLVNFGFVGEDEDLYLGLELVNSGTKYCYNIRLIEDSNRMYFLYRLIKTMAENHYLALTNVLSYRVEPGIVVLRFAEKI